MLNLLPKGPLYVQLILVFLEHEDGRHPHCVDQYKARGILVLQLLQVLSDFNRTRVRSLAMLVTHSLTDSLTHCRLVNLIDVTLACEDAYSKLVKVVTVADVSDEDRVGNNLWQI